MKQRFLDDELWILSVTGAFQRAKIYLESANEKAKAAFRLKLRDKIIELSKKYMIGVSDLQHISNINKLINDCPDEILVDGRLKFGPAQKLLNLFLKYEWCRELLPEPPHCPVDRIVLSELDKYNPVSWTKLSGADDYLNLIQQLKTLATTQNLSLPEWELQVFNRRNTSTDF